ncbi:XkdX family protein [Clostridium sardiniense]|uniref:XkdX family protein n=2 Tax=Clostridium sardiniense TaxID=29369 RepID=A0ABS7KUP0_CLOSR|nr:XkdX family protein [Clostridium sardiniense]
MYRWVKKLYLQGRADERELESAVKKNWITEEEKEEIIASKKDITEKKRGKMNV